jgi:hypothetical protein
VQASTREIGGDQAYLVGAQVTKSADMPPSMRGAGVEVVATTTSLTGFTGAGGIVAAQERCLVATGPFAILAAPTARAALEQQPILLQQINTGMTTTLQQLSNGTATLSACTLSETVIPPAVYVPVVATGVVAGLALPAAATATSLSSGVTLVRTAAVAVSAAPLTMTPILP